MKFSRPTRYAALAACAAGLTLAGCLSGNTSAESDAARPGQIRLVSMNGLAKAAVSASGGLTFTLDTARTSFQQYFILQNTGDVPVTDIVLTTNNPNFTFSPSRIAVLHPSADAAVIQVIKLNIVHGTLVDAVGQGPYLPMGLLTVNASVSGVTDSGGSEVTVGETVSLTTFVKLARFEMGSSDSTLQTVDKLSYGLFMGPVLGYPYNMYRVPVDSTGGNTNPDLILKNTGNVALTIEVRDRTGPEYSIVDSLVLQPDSAHTFKNNIFRVDAHGTTFAPWQTPVESDGKVLFSASPDF
jgi:hypothetical protein